MRLTLLRCVGAHKGGRLTEQTFKFPKGSVWKGKYRLSRPVFAAEKLQLLQRLNWELESMRFLSKPYLTEAEEASQADWETRVRNYEHVSEFQRNMRHFENNSIDEHLEHLRDLQGWD